MLVKWKCWFFLIIFSVISAQILVAQSKQSWSKTDVYELEKEIRPVGTQLPFNQINFTDYRFDTTKEGFFEQYASFLRFHFAGGAARTLTNWFSHFTNGNADLNLQFVIRSLWLRDLKAAEINFKEYTDRTRICQFIVKLDAYVVKDGFLQAAFRIDSVFTTKGSAGDKKEEVISAALQYISNKIGSFKLAAIEKKKKYTATQVYQEYEKLHAKATGIKPTVQRGIYLNFDDFLNNKITVRDFLIEEGEKGDFLYVIENGEEKLFTSYWGFADNGKNFIRVENNIFMLIPDQKTFSFWGCHRSVYLNNAARSEKRVRRYVFFGVFGELHHARLKNELRPMQVDMETGNVY